MNDQSQPGKYDISNSWLDELSDDLSDEYLVVAEPEIEHVRLTGIVVVPQGIVVLHARDWTGDIVPSAIGSWRQQVQFGGSKTYPNPTKDLHASEQALRHFIREEFSDLKVTIVQLIVLTNPDAQIVGRPLVGNMLVIRRSEVAQEVNALVSAMPGEPLSSIARDELATALVERKLTRNQRATSPFVFRSSSFLGSNRKAWTLAQLFQYMSRNPNDGIYHMRNGTLEKWLVNQGALHMAKLVHDVTNESGHDPRAAFEKMIAKSGLVKSHGIVVHPHKIDLGRVLAGYDCADTITVKSNSRQGYVVASLETSESWLRVDPKQISGGETKVNVRVDTSKLPIQAKPFSGMITLVSELTPRPINIPVKVRVVVEPSAFVRLVIRPIIGAIIAGVLGAFLGLLLGVYGPNPPGFIANLLPALTPVRLWMLIVGVFWVLWGIIRGFQQPLTLPIDVWLLRWFIGTLLWMLPFGIVSLALIWMLGAVPSTANLTSPPIRSAILIGALALSIVPAVLDRSRAFTTGQSLTSGALNTRRPFVVTLISMSLATLTFAGLLYVPSLWRSDQVQGTKAGAQTWITDQYHVVKTRIDSWIETYYMQRYDHRAKTSPTPTPSIKRPSPTLKK